MLITSPPAQQPSDDNGRGLPQTSNRGLVPTCSNPTSLSLAGHSGASRCSAHCSAPLCTGGHYPPSLANTGHTPQSPMCASQAMGPTAHPTTTALTALLGPLSTHITLVYMKSCWYMLVYIQSQQLQLVHAAGKRLLRQLWVDKHTLAAGALVQWTRL